MSPWFYVSLGLGAVLCWAGFELSLLRWQARFWRKKFDEMADMALRQSAERHDRWMEVVRSMEELHVAVEPFRVKSREVN